MPRHDILGIPFFTGTIEEAVDQALGGGLVVAPSGPNLAGELRAVPAYRAAVTTADIALTDSAVMVAFYRMATGRRVPRHSGLKFLEYLLERPIMREPGAAFHAMPSEAEGREIAAWLRSRGCPVDEGSVYVAPFYRGYPIEDEELLRRVREVRPKVIFLNLAGGKQEVLGAWLRANLDPCPAIVCTGAAIAFLAGTQANIPVWADRSGLGWFLRCLHEPRKFVPRYWSALPLLWLVWRYRERLPVS